MRRPRIGLSGSQNESPDGRRANSRASTTAVFTLRIIKEHPRAVACTVGQAKPVSPGKYAGARKSEPAVKRVAIVGGGVMGLAAAYYAAKAGHSAAVIEAGAEPGGMA